MNYSTQSPGYEVQVNLKFGDSNEHMVNLPASDENSLLEKLDMVAKNANFIRYAADALKHANGGNVAVSEAQAVANVQAQFPTTTPVQPGVIQPQQPQTYGQQPTNPAVCPGHGLPWREHSGNKNGKQWHGLFCAGPQNGPIPQCKPIFS